MPRRVYQGSISQEWQSDFIWRWSKCCDLSQLALTLAFLTLWEATPNGGQSSAGLFGRGILYLRTSQVCFFLLFLSCFFPVPNPTVWPVTVCQFFSAHEPLNQSSVMFSIGVILYKVLMVNQCTLVQCGINCGIVSPRIFWAQRKRHFCDNK